MVRKLGWMSARPLAKEMSLGMLSLSWLSAVSIDGRGSYEPIASNATAEGRARNRRVEIFMAEVAPAQ